MIKGIYHSHSDFSYDGVKSLDEISRWCRERDFAFIILTEHNDDFTLNKFRDYHEQCERYSNGVLLIPGIEYEFIVNGRVVHVGALGLDKYFDINENPIPIESFLDDAKEAGGVTILHHPHRIMDELSHSVIRKFDFIEAWNVVYDIRYAPNKKVIEMARRKGFTGQYLASRDIHYYRDKDRSPYIVFENDFSVKSSREIIESLLAGQYHVNLKIGKIRTDGTFEHSKMIFKYLPIIAFIHQKMYEKLRYFYKKIIKISPPKWIVRAIK